MRLLGTELRRFFARRAIWVLIVCALGISSTVNIVQFIRSSAPAASGSGAVVSIAPNTIQGEPPPNGEFFVRGVPNDNRVKIGNTFEGAIRGMGIALVVLAIMLAATFLAADYGTSLAGQVLFEPRRRFMFATKTAAAALGSAGVAVAVIFWTGLLQFVTSATRGVLDGVDGAWLAHRIGDTARVGVAVALGAVIAIALTAFTRRTGGTIGALFGLLVGVQFLGAVRWGRGIAHYQPLNSIWATAFGKFEEGNQGFPGIHSLAAAFALAALWGIGSAMLATWWFARTEIR